MDLSDKTEIFLISIPPKTDKFIAFKTDAFMKFQPTGGQWYKRLFDNETNPIYIS